MRFVGDTSAEKNLKINKVTSFYIKILITWSHDTVYDESIKSCRTSWDACNSKTSLTVIWGVV